MTLRCVTYTLGLKRDTSVHTWMTRNLKPVFCCALYVLQSYGATVERMPTSELQPAVDRYVAEQGLHFLHPFDDLDIIAGHARCDDIIFQSFDITLFFLQ